MSENATVIEQPTTGVQGAVNGFVGISGPPGIQTTELPDYFIDPDEKHKIEAHVVFKKSNGKLLKVVGTTEGANFDDDVGVAKEWFIFTQPTYDDMATYRQRCTIYSQSAQRMVVDGTQLRHYLLVWHLKDWSLKDRKTGLKIELVHDKAGTLSDESLKAVTNRHPAIIDAAMSQFERMLLLA